MEKIGPGKKAFTNEHIQTVCQNLFMKAVCPHQQEQNSQILC